MKILEEGEKRLTNGFGIFEDIGDIPLDEIMALGIGLTAAVAAAVVMEETWNRLNQTTDERIRKAELRNENNQMMLDFQSKTQKDAVDGIANILKETFVAGSILPDKVG